MRLKADPKELRELIRSIPDFPKKGILFRDITTLLKDGPGFKAAVQLMAAHYRDADIASIVCIEARGFILGSAMAYEMGCGVVPIRKPGKLPYETITQTYDLEYGTDSVEVHKDAIQKGERVLLVDDLLATGGTARAAADLIEKLGGEIASCAFLIELADLNGRKLLDKYDIFSVITYE
ncbi:adenine phosphoribosyltransferase [Candidatus Eisenbacteria bacterium]|uniref:Adenine phosphoribosyltransferase n=1 Tax=Eiseniibacteriota bacterium TaxID=2212470 RepID=A0ABV6YNB9_UNCEI